MASDLGYDLSCVSDLTADMADVSGRTQLAQAIARRITTPRGSLIDDPNYGIDVTDWINDDVSSADLGRIGVQIDAEAAKDERIVRSTTVVTFASGVLVANMAIQDGVGPFKLVLAISDVTVSILKVA